MRRAQARWLLRTALGAAGMLAAQTGWSATEGYTYVKASLGYPWFMFFVFMLLVLIPFLTIILLSWHRHRSGGEENTGTQADAPPGVDKRMDGNPHG